jgi:hypothetical protein
MKHFQGFVRAVLGVAVAWGMLHSVALAATNSWITPASGDWHVPTNWSFGILPNSSQSVLIDAPGWKAVNINGVTSGNFPESLTVHDLTISNNSTQDLNTLLLNYAGTNTPLRVLNGLLVKNAARIVNFNSGLVVDGGDFVATNAELIQDGGLVRATNGFFYLESSAYYFTNGEFQAGTSALLGNSVFNQYGGSATVRQLAFCCMPSSDGTYSLAGGQLRVQDLDMDFDNNGAATFVQTGGTNHAPNVSMRSGLYGISADYTLNGGLLESSNVFLQSGPGSARFHQNGGVHSCKQTLTLQGTLWHGQSPRLGSYFLGNGQLFAGSLVVLGFGEFIQSNGLASISGVLELGGDTYSRWGSSLSGGTLACSNLVSSGGGANFQQTGGAFFVTNLFSFGGEPTCCAPNSAPFYSFSGGTLSASNMAIGTFRDGTNAFTRFILGSSAAAGRITNPGYFSLAGILQSGDANEQLGSFILAASSIIDLGPGNAKLRFAASSGQVWNANASLYVTNWAGSPSGGGNDQLKFGSNPSGLSSAQLQKIVFSNPAGFAPGNYSAQILSTGEVVPTARASVGLTHSRTNLVLTWPAGWTLQSATNVTGPYMDVSGATSPYTNLFSSGPRRFFRLRQ